MSAANAVDPSQLPNRLLDLFCQRWIIVSAQVQGLSESDLYLTSLREVLTAVKDFLDSTQPHRYDRDAQPGRDEPDAGLKRMNLASLGSLAFGEEQNGPSTAHQISQIP